MYHRRQKGYVEQQIEAVALVLARIIGLKASGDYPAAQIEVSTAFQNVSGLNIATVLALPESMAATSFQNANQIDPGRAIAAAMLLEEHAEIVARRGLEGSSHSALRRALVLYVESIATDETLRTPEFEARVSGLFRQIGDDELAATVRKRLKMPF